jgi:hypothetical protein
MKIKITLNCLKVGVLNYPKLNLKILLKDNCKDFINSKLLQRDKQRFDSKYSYINPKKFKREPLMMSDGDCV